MRRRMYTASAIENMIEAALEKGYEIITIREGVLGYGKMVFVAPDGYYNYIVEEKYINEWSSGHIVSRRKNLSKEIISEIEQAEQNIA